MRISKAFALVAGSILLLIPLSSGSKDLLTSPPPVPDLKENLKPATDQKAAGPTAGTVPGKAPPAPEIKKDLQPTIPAPEKKVITETAPQPQTGKKVPLGAEPVIVSRMVRNLKEGKEGEEAEVVLKGKNLHRITQATATGVRVSIVTRSATEMTLKVKGQTLSIKDLMLHPVSGKPFQVPLREEVKKARAEAAKTRRALPETGAVPKPEAGTIAVPGAPGGADSGSPAEAVAQPGGRGGGSAPKYDSKSDEFQFSSGHRIPGSDPSGSRGKINEKGDVVYSQGTMVSHDPESGSTTVIRPDGSTVTHHRDGSDTVHDSRSGTSIRFGKHSDSAIVRSDPKYNRDTDTFDFGDGTKIRASDRKGERGKITDRGDIQYGDGTLVIHDEKTGQVTIIRPDGSTRTSYGDDHSINRRDRGGRGPAYDPDSDSFVYGDGTKIKARDPQGRLSGISDKGDIVGADGTIITHDDRTGSVTIVHPDGSNTMYGRDRATGTRALFGDHGDSSFQQGADKTYSTDGGNIMNIERSDGSRDVTDRKTGVTVHFGDHGDSQSVQGGNKGDGKSGGSSPGGRGSGGTSSNKGGSGSSGSGGSASGTKSNDTRKNSTKQTGKDTTKDSSGKDGGSKDGGTKDSGDKPDGGKDGGAKEIGVGGTAVSGPSSTAGTKIEDRKNMTRKRDDGGVSGGSQPCEPGSQPVPGEECTREEDPVRPEVEERKVGLPYDTSAESTKYNPADPDRFRDDSGMGGRTIDPFDRMPVINPNP